MIKDISQPLTVTEKRIQAENDITKMAGENGVSVDTFLTTILKDNKTQSQLITYIRAKRESPADKPLKIATQAALLRLADIAAVAKNMNISNAKALHQLEDSENERGKINQSTAATLPIDVQAMLVILIDEIIVRSNGAGIASNTLELSDNLKTAIDKNSQRYYAPVLKPLIISRPDNAAGSQFDFSQIGAAPSPTDNSGDQSTLDSIFDYINTAINTVKNASGAIGAISGNVSGGINTVGGAINNLGGGIGASALNKSSIPLIISAGFALVIIVIIIIYASKR